MAERIYLDHAATTPMRPQAIAAVEEGMRHWANPSSPHAEGRAARAALEDARARIKAALGWDGELIFTSGASEAIAIAMQRAKVARRLVSAVEHDAVFRAAPDADVLPMTNHGALDSDALNDKLATGEPAVVAIQHINSETGTIQPLERYSPDIRAEGGLLLVDCSQSAGKYDLPDADFIVVSAHKLGGPPGIGALLVRDLATLEPSGGQEFGYRYGTENLPAALGFAAAVETAWSKGGVVGWLDAMHQAILDLEYPIARAGGDLLPVVGNGAMWSLHIAAIAMPNVSAAAQLMQFDMQGISVSAGSACSSGSLKTSRVLKAFHIPDDVAARTIRVSFGWSTTADDIQRFLEVWLDIARRARDRAA